MFIAEFSFHAHSLAFRGIPMIRTGQSKLNLTIPQAIDKILAVGQINRQEHLQLTSAILSDFNLTDEDRRQINRIFDYIQMGRMEIVDL